MDKSEVRIALGEAYKEQVRLLYKVYCQSSVMGDTNASTRFHEGVVHASRCRDELLRNYM